MQTTMWRWDVVCRVIDNYGDIGACWRLTRLLAAEFGADVRLWVDDLPSFARFCPTVLIDAVRRASAGEPQRKPRFFSGLVSEESALHVERVPCILMNMDLTTEDRRPSQDSARLTPGERLERFIALQRRAMQLLVASPDGYRRYWERNVRQRSIHAKY